MTGGYRCTNIGVGTGKSGGRARAPSLSLMWGLGFLAFALVIALQIM